MSDDPLVDAQHPPPVVPWADELDQIFPDGVPWDNPKAITPESKQRLELLGQLYDDRPLAHEVLFKHRRGNVTPLFHKKMILDFHNTVSRQVLMMAFRGSAKSTLAEEALLLMAAFREFKNGLIICETEARAIERLRAIRHEIETNELLAELFLDLKGPTWTETELILSNDVRLLALGRGQALRGVKHHDMRPDAVFCDDIESLESVSDERQREKTRVWFFTVLLPACDPDAIVRVAQTPLDPDALAVRLAAEDSWLVHLYPIKFINDDGEEEATWPDRFPIKVVDSMEATFTRQGLQREFQMEYMVTSTASQAKSFSKDMIVVLPRIRTWHAVYGMFDPARTTNKKSATTGFAAWSWIGNRLIVWDAWAEKLMPDQILERIFDFALDDVLHPTLIGVEEDGLNEFLLQPIRQEMVKRGVMIPYKALKAPKGKFDFIRGLQPFFKAREVEFAKPLPDLVSQLVGFPTGAIDAPNALAYALKMRPGAPVYDDFGTRNVTEDIKISPQTVSYLAMNATSNCVTGALCQYADGRINIFADWIFEGNASERASDLVALAGLEAGRKMKVVCGPMHFDVYNNVGLRQALARVPVEAVRGGQPSEGQAVIRSYLQREVRSIAALRIAEDARWTMNAFAGGYAREMTKRGVLSSYADEGPYRVLMEGLESFAASLRPNATAEDDEAVNYAYTASGSRYRSALK